MTGWKTIVTNGSIALLAILTMFGITVDGAETEAVVAGLVALVNIALRVKTRTEVFKK